MRPTLQFFLLLASCLAAGAVHAQQPARVPPEVARLALGSPVGDVVAHLYKPAGAGPFPLVIYAHGRAGSEAERLALENAIPIGHANYWLRKGVAVVAPFRPGYGATRGADLEDHGARWKDGVCLGTADFQRTATQARRTLVATYEWALQQPWVRKDRILFEGQSVGGFGTAATAALNLPGVVGTVNFAGGSGGNPERSPGRSCQPDRVRDVYQQFGREAKAPSLWLYAPNDLYWGPDMPTAWHQAYRLGGSDTELVVTAPVPGADGHALLAQGGRLWSAPLDAFVKKVGLTAP